jgi:multisubunit Na+/H+ antiporter MnhE subunit
MNKLMTTFTPHRRLIAAVIGVVVALLGERAGVGANALIMAVITIISYIAGTAVEDATATRF